MSYFLNGFKQNKATYNQLISAYISLYHFNTALPGLRHGRPREFEEHAGQKVDGQLAKGCLGGVVGPFPNGKGS